MKTVRRVSACIAVGFTVLVAGCVTPAPSQTSLQIQEYQSKNFEVEKKTAFNSVLSVLQDMGYIVGSASFETGFISAESPAKNDTGFWDAMGGVRREQKVAVTASIEDMKTNLSRVRLNFVTRQKRSGAYGQQANDDAPVLDQKLYANAFDKIGEAVFIRTSQK
jgi:hypothetical protein